MFGGNAHFIQETYSRWLNTISNVFLRLIRLSFTLHAAMDLHADFTMRARTHTHK